ncbi:uncharacterized protein [Nerophis lumbriciformis]|uniref:uncharacterized protein n=1 Tax=Nerophis lumbriciformis TaxID=546530 RepID=UPI002AE087A0|nr:uncharacterized protein LOC133571914 [Nerophis lumbriciformis]
MEHDGVMMLRSTAIGIRCKDGVVFGVEKLVLSKLYEEGSNKHIFNIDRHVGMAVTGLLADARSLAEVAREEASNFRSNYGHDIPLKVSRRRVVTPTAHAASCRHTAPVGACGHVRARLHPVQCCATLWLQLHPGLPRQRRRPAALHGRPPASLMATGGVPSEKPNQLPRQKLQDLLYRWSRALPDYESANKALDKARAKNRDVLQAESSQQLCCHKFDKIDKISDSAKQELIDFKTRRVAAFRKNLVELAELELKHAKVRPAPP